jgi:hypothetical protein
MGLFEFGRSRRPVHWIPRAWLQACFRVPSIHPAPAVLTPERFGLSDFIGALAQELRFRGVAFERGALGEFAVSVWPLAQDDPDAERWAMEFLENG